MEIAQEALDKIIEEIKHIHAESIHHMRDAALQQLKRSEIHFEEKLEEMRRQNDGLLGAVGRLQTERTEAIKKLEEHKARESDREQTFKMHAFAVERHIQDDRMKTKEEIAGYKREISDLQAKLKKQTKK